MNVFTQEKWLGVARKTAMRDDARTSQYELNTQPGDNALKKIYARKPYIDTGDALPAAAMRFQNQGEYAVLYDENGSTVDLGCDGASENHIITVCFKWDGMKQADTSQNYYLISSRATSSTGCDLISWCIRFTYSSSAWHIEYGYREDDSTFHTLTVTTVDLDPDTWYYIRASDTDTLGSDTPTVYVYADGNTTPADTVNAASFTRNMSTDTFETILGSPPADYPAMTTKLSISHVALYFDDSFGEVSWKWYGVVGTDAINATVAETADMSFGVFDPRSSIQPGRVKESTGDNYSWILFPQHNMRAFLSTESGNSLPPYGSGVKTTGFSSIIGEFDHLEFFENRNVFVFEADFDANNEHFFAKGRYFLCRAPDDSFKVYYETDGTNSYIKVIWTPVNWTAGAVSRGYQSETISTDLSDSCKGCFAVEVVPIGDHTNENNIYIFEWGGTSWSDITLATSDKEEGEGVKEPIGSEWIFAEPVSCSGIIYDIKIFMNMPSDWHSSGSFNWPIVTTKYPRELEAWYSHYASDGYVGSDKIKYFVDEDKAGFQNKTIGLADRRTGDYLWKINPYIGNPSYDYEPYMENQFKPEIQDIVPIDEGGLRIATDAYTYEYYPSGASQSSTGQSKYGPRSNVRQMWTSIGSHQYITGAGPLQRVSKESSLIGFYPPIVTSFPKGDSETTASIIDEGSITQGTQQLYKITLYDPRNGDESNPFGPWRFEVEASTGGEYAFVVDFELESPEDLSQYQIRVYRYYASTGYYYLEGAANIGGAEIVSSTLLYKSRFTCNMSDTTLQQQTRLSYVKDNPPEHNVCTIWAGRGWYVDAFDPSRIRFSDQYELGTAPASNVIWTDEGLTGKILGFLPGFGGLLCLKERSIWMIPSFQDPTGVVAQPLVPDIGVVSGDAAVFVNGMLIWAAPGGIYMYDGSNMPNELSERLDGIEVEVWKDAPRKTKCWYDRANSMIVFVCAGAAITIDIPSNAISFATLADTCYTHLSHTDYAGSLYGASGMVWQEVRDKNESITLDSNERVDTTTYSDEYSLMSTFTPTEFSWVWYNGKDTGTRLIGFSFSSTYLPAPYQWEGCPIGRSYIEYDLDTPIAWAVLIECCGRNVVSGNTVWFGRFERSLTGNQGFYCMVPWYYKSQRNYLGSKGDAKRLQRLDFITGSTGSDDGVHIEVTSEAQVYTEADSHNVSERGIFKEYDVLILPVRLKGNDFVYELLSAAKDDQAEIRTVRHHYRRIRPRGRVR